MSKKMKEEIENPQNQQKEKKVSKIPFNFYSFAGSRGLLAGILMGLYVLMLEVLGAGDSLALKLLKYFFLAIVMYRALRTYKFVSPAGKTFKNGIVMGAGITIVSGLVFVALHLLSFFIDQSVVFDRFTLNSRVTDFPKALMLSWAYLLETFVVGMTIAFISLQFLKDAAPPK